MRILIVEDEEVLARALVKIFEKNNYSADAVFNGADALHFLASGNYDAAVFDVMMPMFDGISLLQKIRSEGNNIPVLLLTAKSDIDDKVIGLDAGADYYLTKPFDTKELLAVIRVITRCNEQSTKICSFGNVILDTSSFEMSTSYGTVRLMNKEFQMMEMLMFSPRNIISVDRFMENIWGYETEAEVNVVWVYISYLRKKLSSIKATVEIKSSRNAGYYLEEKR